MWPTFEQYLSENLNESISVPEGNSIQTVAEATQKAIADISKEASRHGYVLDKAGLQKHGSHYLWTLKKDNGWKSYFEIGMATAGESKLPSSEWVEVIETVNITHQRAFSRTLNWKYYVIPNPAYKWRSDFYSSDDKAKYVKMLEGLNQKLKRFLAKDRQLEKQWLNNKHPDQDRLPTPPTK